LRRHRRRDNSIMRPPSRRALCRHAVGLALASSPLTPQFSTAFEAKSLEFEAKSLTAPQAAIFIREQCDPKFLSAVRSAGQLLYRGEKVPASMEAELLSPPPDLLVFETYNSKQALAYFEALERGLLADAADARPSTAHIGVANREAAERWGDPVSIWPLKVSNGLPVERFHYCWPAERTDFWPAADGVYRERDYKIDKGLAEALEEGKEVMFTGGYVAVSERAESEVRRLVEFEL